MSTSSSINVEVAYALPDRQKIVALQVPEGTTALQAAERSGLTETFDGIDLQAAKMGVFGKAVKPKDYKLREGDRVEIYRPLLVDPKKSRKERAAKSRARKSEDKTD